MGINGPGRARLGCRGIVSVNLSELTFPETLSPHARCGCIGPAVASPSDPHAFHGRVESLESRVESAKKNRRSEI
jgi:hypothetical protein